MRIDELIRKRGKSEEGEILSLKGKGGGRRMHALGEDDKGRCSPHADQLGWKGTKV